MPSENQRIHSKFLDCDGGVLTSHERQRVERSTWMSLSGILTAHPRVGGVQQDVSNDVMIVLFKPEAC